MGKVEASQEYRYAGEQKQESLPRRHLIYLAVGALGVVYGDIGTSPLYAFRESFHSEYGLAVTPLSVTPRSRSGVRRTS